MYASLLKCVMAMMAMIEARTNEVNPKISHLFINRVSATSFWSLSKQYEWVCCTVTVAPFRALLTLYMMISSITPTIIFAISLTTESIFGGAQGVGGNLLRFRVGYLGLRRSFESVFN